jgi:metal-responsive CopG/Arc/MetJ family transcriptional regulator
VLQATAEELGVLDSLVVELGAESRSELIAAAIEAHLLTKSRR